eukprot:Protomagalhaensia_sp_Gyna_25__2653@NODE_2512_length_1044_cov_1313_074627_g2082_i0_p3_GENE_NODE_2512_length_1044_cov_1313_074627_g2082_i0NODE_2512_length_1044_cov_1313_074627_g2082_i0_p3_ORF_typecomplete_len117_score24_73Ribosomal_L31e/PF01198_19/1_7e27TAFII55_N/PF04658_13/0_013Inp1/PF12634_7/0_071_NODE_2512_length_1044_cov_1313_074627_g2082_i0596946
MAKGEHKELTPMTLETTIHVSRFVKHVAFKKCAPRAIRVIKKEAEKMMKTKDVRIDTELNKYIFSHGIRYPPRRVRVRFCRKRQENEDSDEKFYTYVQFVYCSNFHGLTPQVIEEQ